MSVCGSGGVEWRYVLIKNEIYHKSHWEYMNTTYKMYYTIRTVGRVVDFSLSPPPP